MGKSARLRLGDVRRAFRLVGDCRELGRDRAAWTHRAAAGLRDELGAVMVVVSHIAASPPAGDAIRPGRNLFDVGWPCDRDREAWLGLLRGGRIPTFLTVAAMYRLPGPLVVRSRDQIVGRRAWARCTERNEDRMPLGQDETLIGLLRHPGGGGAHMAFSINREVGGGGFDGRERALLRLFIGEVAALAGPTLAIAEPDEPARLTPRARMVLDALVRGDAEKQIAARLGISRHTVHDYVKALYRRYDVSSRGELLAAHYRAAGPG